jgi:hypothetical protein
MPVRRKGEYCSNIGHSIVASPTAGATVYCGLSLVIAPDSTEANRRFQLPKSGRITRAKISFNIAGALDTGANLVTVYSRINSVDYLIGTTDFQTVTSLVSNLAMSAPFTELQNMSIKIVYPASWTQQPTNVTCYGVLYIETP